MSEQHYTETVVEEFTGELKVKPVLSSFTGRESGAPELYLSFSLGSFRTHGGGMSIPVSTLRAEIDHKVNDEPEQLQRDRIAQGLRELADRIQKGEADTKVRLD